MDCLSVCWIVMVLKNTINQIEMQIEIDLIANAKISSKLLY